MQHLKFFNTGAKIFDKKFLNEFQIVHIQCHIFDFHRILPVLYCPVLNCPVPNRPVPNSSFPNSSSPNSPVIYAHASLGRIRI